jgi:hypothetical protein
LRSATCSKGNQSELQAGTVDGMKARIAMMEGMVASMKAQSTAIENLYEVFCAVVAAASPRMRRPGPSATGMAQGRLDCRASPVAWRRGAASCVDDERLASIAPTIENVLTGHVPGVAAALPLPILGRDLQ